ncbi:hypothetical protein EZV62_007901 [Acer yangbiense]|uniref:Peptidase S26 domain-containing protein n=1 Tax=Acer yangbiense TaxID=1000413 RepID=A0A5C7IE03_9ROSI|nr:hypothetical protein EZV62_007901 [Acer yangbiense]
MGGWRVKAKEAITQVSITARFLCLLHFTNNYLFSPTLVYGPSMLPTLNLTGDIVLSEHFSHRLGRVRAGDLVLLRLPVDPAKIAVKRIVAMEGDRVTFFDSNASDLLQTLVVPKGHVWIQGDNLYASRDSRHFGPVPYGLIQGRAFLRNCSSWKMQMIQGYNRIMMYGHFPALDHWNNEHNGN